MKVSQINFSKPSHSYTYNVFTGEPGKPYRRIASFREFVSVNLHFTTADRQSDLVLALSDALIAWEDRPR